MRWPKLGLLFLLLSVTLSCYSQSYLRGRIFDASTDSVVNFVNITNKTRGFQAQSGKDGHYQIRAFERDLIIFTSVGYIADSLVVEEYMLRTGYDLGLKLQLDSLSAVIVQARRYSADSLSRREWYRHILDRPLPGITGRNTPSGFGISLSPISYFSRKGKQQRRLKKRLLHDEEQAYVDVKFPREYVAKLTGLSGDSLQTFMYRYRPSYEFCRKANEEDMFVYINNKLKEYRRPKLPEGKKR